MKILKEYVKNNSETLFRSVKSNNAIIFDNRGFFFSDEAQNKYDQIKNTPHLYVAWTEHIKGFNYIGISNQPRGRWQRSHAYHMGTLAYHLLETLNKYDQNHKHWIDNWMQIESLNLGDNEHNINLNQEVKICFIPFELYTNKDYNLLDKNYIKKINKKTEEDLIKSYLSDNLTLLNVQKNNNSKKTIKQTSKINLIKANSNSDENCVTFEVKRNENISIVADSISNLPTGPCSIELFYSNRADTRIYINGKKRNIPTLKRSVSQYFNAPDTANGKIPKWKIVQNEMNEPNNIINKITVKVCKIVNNRNTKPKTKNKVTPILLKGEANKKIKNTLNKKTDVLNLSKNFKVVMICAGGKNDSFFTSYPDNNFVNEPNENQPNENQPNENHPDEIMNDGITWREYLNINQSDANLLKAYELYKPRKTGIYTRMYNKYLNRFFILSAGWGLVKSDFKLPKYDITFSSSSKNKNAIRNKKTNYKDYNQLNTIGKEDIIFIGSPDYIPLFIKLTQNLKNRKVIYWKGMTPQPVPVRFPIPNNTFIYRFYNTTTNTNWFYEVANDFCNGIIP